MMVDMHGAMAEIVGYVDATRGLGPDTTVIEGEYWRDYMRGFLRGRTHGGRERVLS